MSYKVLPLALLTFSLLFPIYVSSNSYASSSTTNTCEFKVLIQVPLLGDVRVSDQDQVIKGKYWYHDLEQAVYYLRDRLKSYLKSRLNCEVKVDYQLRLTPRPRHWWTPEYGGNQPEINLVSNYNLIIFIGHGRPGTIYFDVNDTNRWGLNRSYVNFTYSSFEDQNGKIHNISISYILSYIHGKSWVMIIGCEVFRRKGHVLSDIRQYLFSNGTSDPNNLSNVYLLGVLGYEVDFPYIQIRLIGNDLILDDYVRDLALYLTETPSDFYIHGMQYEYYLPQVCRIPKQNGLNIVDAWFCASDKFAHTFSVNVKPAVFYIIMIDKRTHTIVYDPNKPIYKISSLKTPREIYYYYRNNGLLKYLEIHWVYATSLKDVYGFYYQGAGSKSYYSLSRHSHGGGGGALWGIRIKPRCILMY